MEKKIEDYLPYYIGQEVKVSTDGREIDYLFIQGYNKNTGLVNLSDDEDYNTDYVKLRLRPLSDIKEEDFYSFFGPDTDKHFLVKAKINRMWCATWYDKKDYDERVEEELPVDPNTLIYDMEESDYDNVWSCDMNGTIAHGTGEEIRFFVDVTEQAAWVNHLRKQGIDCDGLIKAGLAVDKTKEGK